LQANKERYKKDRRSLQRQGWRVLTIWECQTKKLEEVTTRIINFLELGDN
jgi:DNA mismatch endonuclease (patch repair protein)